MNYLEKSQCGTFSSSEIISTKRSMAGFTKKYEVLLITFERGLIQRTEQYRVEKKKGKLDFIYEGAETTFGHDLTNQLIYGK